MARSIAPDHQHQRDRIVRHAVQAFATTGFASASLAELAKACDVSKATLYHYFESKDAILFAALDAYTKRLLTVVDTAKSQELQAKEAVRSIVRALALDYSQARSEQVSLLFDVKFLPEAQRAQIKRQERAIVESIAQALQLAYPARFTARNRKALTMALLGSLNFSFAWFRPHGELRHEEFADLVIELWESGLQATHA
jgi:AcrR family transcriptional regulator